MRSHATAIRCSIVPSLLVALAGSGQTLAGSPFPASIHLSTLNGANGFVLNGVSAFNQSGTLVSCVGDVNGDGIDDMIIGASFFTAFEPNHSAAYVVFGRDTAVDGLFPASIDLATLDGTNGFSFGSLNPGDNIGRSATSAGDVNGDGIDDLIIGAPGGDPLGYNSNAGESYVIFGRDTELDGPFAASINLSTLDGTNGFVLNGIDFNDGSGRWVSSAGDVNGDGIDDLIIGAVSADPNGQSNAGESYIVFGKDTAVDGPFPASFNLSTLNGANGFILNGIDAGDLSGVSVSSAGDVNGDGISDLIIGASAADPNGQVDAGESYVVFGGPGVGASGSINLSTLNGTNGFVINGIDAGDRSGITVSSAGDVNGDGIDDLILGADLADPNGQSNAGESYIVFGKDTAVDGPFGASIDLSTLDGTNGFVLNGIGAEDRSGWSASSAGDVNGDGIDDLIIGAFQADPGGVFNLGQSYVVYGRNTAVDGPFSGSIDLSSLNGTNGFVLTGIDVSDRSGSSVASAGDVNGDGIDDLIIGAYGASPDGMTWAGESYVVFGRAAQAWTSPAGGSWDTGAKWLSGVAPTKGVVVIETPIGVTVTGPVDPVYLKRLTLNAFVGRTTVNLLANSFMEVEDPLTIPPTGRISGSGVLVADAGIVNAGVIEPTDLVVVAQAGLTNSGDIRLEGFAMAQTENALSVYGGPLTNEAGGEVVVKGPTIIDASDGFTNESTISFAFADAIVYGVVDTAGLVSISGGSTVLWSDDASNFGTIELTTDSSLSILGSLTGSGVSGPGGGASGPVYVEGGIVPGPVLGPGIASFGGDVTMGSVGTTTIEIGGTTPGSSHDQIAALGDIVAGGTLEVVVIEGYIPQAGDVYIVLDGATITGSFASIVLDPALVNANADVSTLLMDGTIRIPGAPTCAGDVNGDGTTNALDFNILAGNFGSVVPPNTGGDLNGDGTVNALDFNLLAGDFGCSGSGT